LIDALILLIKEVGANHINQRGQTIYFNSSGWWLPADFFSISVAFVAIKTIAYTYPSGR